jgi:hypothetical protein
MAEPIPVNEEYDFSVEWAKFLERRSNSEVKRVHASLYELDSVGLSTKVREQLESARPSAVVSKQAIAGDSKEPEAVLGGRGNVAYSAPRRGEYFGYDVWNIQRRVRNAPIYVGVDGLVVHLVQRFELLMIIPRSLRGHHLYFFDEFTLITCRQLGRICPLDQYFSR